MIDKRLMRLVGNVKKRIAGNVLLQWVSLLCNIFIALLIAHVLEAALSGSLRVNSLPLPILGVAAVLAVRWICAGRASDLAFQASNRVKRVLRGRIYAKLLSLGRGYTETISTGSAVQIASEGVEQLEMFFSRYLPQLFYAVLAPVTLCAVLAVCHLRISLLLLLFVPLIPVIIILIQKLAKRLMSKYWGMYTDLGDGFLENLQGLTVLKTYGADGYKNEQMNERAERFRKITMRVLVMQLNSIAVMDLVAYGGAAVGAALSVAAYRAGQLSPGQTLALILLAAEFFIPMRQLGSYFHIAMNGMAVSARMFELLETEEKPDGTRAISPANTDLVLEHVSFSYTPETEVLHDVTMRLPHGSFAAVVGESGCGKSTVAALLTGQCSPGKGEVTIGGVPISQIGGESRMKNITLLGHDSYIFKGTVRENLLMACPGARDSALVAALQKARLWDFLKTRDRLDTVLSERGENFSGGQRQRLAFARALLHDSPVYIFDEATSNIDVESENLLMAAIRELKRSKTVVLISHRLANVVPAENIYVLAHGKVVEQGDHEQLLQAGGQYAKLFRAQGELQQYGRKKEAHSEEIYCESICVAAV